MAVPKKKTSPARRGNRRSHDKVKITFPTECKNCNEFRLPHNVCLNCGWYKDKFVIQVKKKKNS